MADRRLRPPPPIEATGAGRTARGTGGELVGQPSPATASPIGPMRAMIFSPATERERWIENELSRAKAMVQIGYSVRQIVMALCEDPPPRPQLLMIDLDSLAPGELMQIHEIRDRGWFGTIVALGNVPPALRRSLRIEKVLGAPFVEGALADTLDKHRSATLARTLPLPMFPV